MGFELGKDDDWGSELDSSFPEAPDEINTFLWTPIMQGLCTLHETETVYSLADIVEFNIALRYKNRVENYIQDKALREAKREMK